MKVKALKSTKGYYSLLKDETYEVCGIVYFATPFFSKDSPTEIDDEELRGFINPLFSYGVIRNELVYIIESKTTTGRKTLTRFNAANFEVTDTDVPDDWFTSTIDLYEEVLKVKVLFERHGNQANQFTEPLKALKSYEAKILVTGKKELHSFEYLHAVCDDDLDDE